MSPSPVATTAYIALHDLKPGHSDTINCLRFSPGGDLLASGGDDCALMLWSVDDGRMLFRVLFKSNVSALVWHPIYPDTLIVGCDDGRVFSVHEFSLANSVQRDIQLSVRSNVHSMAYDQSSRYLALSLGREVHLTREEQRDEYAMSIKMPAPAGAPEEDQGERRLRAMSLHFRAKGKELIVSYLFDGVICFDTTSHAVLWKIDPSPQTLNIGSSALSPLGNNLALHNIFTGVNVYYTGAGDDRVLLKRYNHNKTPQSRSRVQVAYAMNGQRLVCGTTTGDVCVWMVESGQIFQELMHDGEISLPCYTISRGNHLYIAAGSARLGQDTYIRLWRASVTGTCVPFPTLPCMLLIFLQDAKPAEAFEIITPVGELVESVNVRAICWDVEPLTHASHRISERSCGCTSCLYVPWRAFVSYRSWLS
ncbi:WD40 repeat-like protein [Trametes versicolor FP-101664 SS1]|uniref:WD40 repeat-like protein n=1 Tax=Trametes versicolor (strain FP-101664) TaxID=717944 RepID=UPI0004622B56|nr:WD40 repeat-like protein [Trametes versicolor FP-101664 SS1]EIW59758.1 WD40 repeat-like protein [Trametes versicolor FP-101664 SS1]